MVMALRTAAGSPTAASSTRQPPSLNSAPVVCGQLEREPGLADSSRSDQREEAVLAGECGELAHLGVAADQRRQRHRHAEAPWRRRFGDRCAAWPVERRILVEDGRLQPPQLWIRVEAQFLAEDAPPVAVHAQRLGLSPGAVQRQHQQPAEPLAERMGGDQRLQLG